MVLNRTLCQTQLGRHLFLFVLMHDALQYCQLSFRKRRRLGGFSFLHRAARHFLCDSVAQDNLSA